MSEFKYSGLKLCGKLKSNATTQLELTFRFVNWLILIEIVMVTQIL